MDGSTYNILDDPINGESNGIYWRICFMSDDGKAAVGAIQNDGTEIMVVMFVSIKLTPLLLH